MTSGDKPEPLSLSALPPSSFLGTPSALSCLYSPPLSDAGNEGECPPLLSSTVTRLRRLRHAGGRVTVSGRGPADTLTPRSGCGYCRRHGSRRC